MKVTCQPLTYTRYTAERRGTLLIAASQLYMYIKHHSLKLHLWVSYLNNKIQIKYEVVHVQDSGPPIEVFVDITPQL